MSEYDTFLLLFNPHLFMGRNLCKRFGPGRLPYASRRDIGGGIAMAATGLLATVVWFAGAWAIAAKTGNGTLGFTFGMGLFFLPLVLPTSFVIGTLLWRKLYPKENRELYGAVFGAMTALASLAVGSLGPALFLAISNVNSGAMPVSEAAGFALLLIPSFVFALVAAGWFVIPLGAFGGWYHERAKATA